jgi:hypothetical protein
MVAIGKANSSPTHVGIGLALAPKGAFRAMARDEYGVVTHRPKALNNAGDQGVMVALRKISSTNGASKQNIANKGATNFR